MVARRDRLRRAACLCGLAGAMLSGGGCASDWGVRRGPSLEEIGEGLLAVGAFVGAGIGLCALSEAGGGENMHYFGTTEYDHNYYDPWR